MIRNSKQANSDLSVLKSIQVISERSDSMSDERISHYKQYTAAHKKYEKSEKGAKARARYQNSDKGLLARARYHERKNVRERLMKKALKAGNAFTSEVELEKAVEASRNTDELLLVKIKAKQARKASD